MTHLRDIDRIVKTLIQSVYLLLVYLIRILSHEEPGCFLLQFLQFRIISWLHRWWYGFNS